MQSRHVITVLTLLLLTGARIIDTATTFHFDPTLQREGNPVVFFFGGKTWSLLMATVAVWLTCVAFLVAFWRGKSLRIRQPPKSLRGFVGTWINRVIRPQHPLRQSLPGGPYWNEGLQAIRLVGLGLPWAVIFGSATAIYSWFAIQHPPQITFYQHLYSTLNVGGLNYFIWLMTPPGFVTGTALFFWSEYRHLRANIIRRGKGRWRQRHLAVGEHL